MNPTPDEVQAVLEDMRRRAQEYVAERFKPYEETGKTDLSKNPYFSQATQSDPSAQDGHGEAQRRERVCLIEKTGSALLSSFLCVTAEHKELSVYQLADMLKIPRGTLWHYKKGDRLWRSDDAEKMVSYHFNFEEEVVAPVIVNPSTHTIKPIPQPRPRKPRRSRGFDADLVTLFDMERDRRGLTNSEYLAALMGVAST